MARTKAPRIVAELGRPETPEETAARKAEQSRLYRARKTVSNLVLSLAVTLAAVAAIIFIVPRDDRPLHQPADYAAIAAQVQQGYEQPLIVPAVPGNWWSNDAGIRTGADGVIEWYIGFIINEGDTAADFAAVSQVLNPNPSWLAERLDGMPPAGSIQLGGENWTEYDRTALPEDETGNMRYVLMLEQPSGTLIVHGSGDPQRVRELAEAVLASQRS